MVLLDRVRRTRRNSVRRRGRRGEWARRSDRLWPARASFWSQSSPPTGTLQHSPLICQANRPPPPPLAMLASPAARLARSAFPPPATAAALTAARASFSSSALLASAPKQPANLPKKPSSTEPHLTPDELASKKLEETNTPPAPYLTRALGVAAKPTKVPQTKEEWRASLLSKEGRVEERRHLWVMLQLRRGRSCN